MIYKDKKIELPENVKYIIRTLENAGYEAYAVGGCVRDSLLHKIPQDFDITTNALPKDVKKLFKNTVDTGIEHGTVSVLIKNNGIINTYEVTTYRVDGKYKDSRHPTSVEFINNLRKDLERRDFTINAFAYNDKVGLVDEFDGIEDLNNSTVRCVGNANNRYTEDALRMMRAIRFSSQLSFSIEKNSYDTILILNKMLEKVSKERVCVELIKTILGEMPEKTKDFFNTKLSDYITEDFNKIKYTKMFFTKSKIQALASLLFEIQDESDIEKSYKLKRKILKDLKLDNYTIKNVSYMLYYKSFLLDNTKLDEVLLKKIAKNLGFTYAKELFVLLENKTGKDYAIYINRLDYYREHNTCISLKELDIDGNDLINEGFKGKELGKILDYLLNMVYLDESLNNKSLLIKEANKWKTSM